MFQHQHMALGGFRGPETWYVPLYKVFQLLNPCKGAHSWLGDGTKWHKSLPHLFLNRITIHVLLMVTYCVVGQLVMFPAIAINIVE